MSYIFKPVTHKGPVWLTSSNEGPPTITLPDGRTFTGVPADQRGGVFHGEHGYQWVFPTDVLGHEGAVLTSGGKSQTLGNTNMSYRGESVGSLSESTKGAVGYPGGFGGGGAAPGQYGYGAYPGYIGNMFPDPAFAKFKRIKHKDIETAPYQYTDPFEFGARYGDFARGQIAQNATQANQIALDQLDTELRGLQNFVPAVSALKRSETALDNIFNQQQRTAQIESTLPGVRGQLEAQAGRAEAYAGGRIPDAQQDRALELGIRSRAADQAYAGGFGPSSSVARKASDLLSAEERIKLSQYGDQLLSGNITQKANLLLAPTSYSNAGQQINVMPSQSISGLAANALSNINQSTIVAPGQALATEVNQQQYKTTLEQGTRTFNATNQLQTKMFNATGKFNESTFNAQAQNQFALAKFGYEAGYANALASALQNDINTNVGLDQQEQDKNTFNEVKEETEKENEETSNIGTGIGVGIGIGLGSVPSIIDLFGDEENSQITVEGDTTDDTSAIGSAGDDVASGAGDSVRSGTAPQQIRLGADGGEGISVPQDFSTDPGVLRSLGVSQANSSYLRNLETDSGIKLSNYVSPAAVGAASAALAASGTRMLQSAGVSYAPRPGYVQSGFDDSGRPVYSDQQMMNSTDTTTGKKSSTLLKNMIKPFGIIGPEDQARMDAIGSLSSDPAILRTLDELQAKGDVKGFLRILQEFVRKTQPTPKNLKRIQKAQRLTNEESMLPV